MRKLGSVPNFSEFKTMRQYFAMRKLGSVPNFSNFLLAHLKQKIFPGPRLMALRPNPEGKGVVAGEVKVEAKKPEQSAA